MSIPLERLGNKHTLSKILCLVSTILLNTMVSLCQIICQASENHAVVSEIVWYCFEVVHSPLKFANHFCHIRHNYCSFTWFYKLILPVTQVLQVLFEIYDRFSLKVIALNLKFVITKTFSLLIG